MYCFKVLVIIVFLVRLANQRAASSTFWSTQYRCLSCSDTIKCSIRPVVDLKVSTFPRKHNQTSNLEAKGALGVYVEVLDIFFLKWFNMAHHSSLVQTPNGRVNCTIQRSVRNVDVFFIVTLGRF